MAIRRKEQLRRFFKRGAYPTESQFGDLMDSMRHKLEPVPMADVQGLTAALNGKPGEDFRVETERGLNDLEKGLGDVEKRVLRHEDPGYIPGKATISCRIQGGRLMIEGAWELVEAGYVPYLFRLTKKRNVFKDKKATDAHKERRGKHCLPTKGWNLYGSRHAVRLSDKLVEFYAGDHKNLKGGIGGAVYTPEAKALVTVGINKDGVPHVAWGRSQVNLTSYGNFRMLRFRFGVGLGPRVELTGRRKFTPADLVTGLAEFTLVFAPDKTTANDNIMDFWHLSRSQ